MSVQVSTGRAKRDISKLVNLVANAGEHIILTSHGKPKAVIVSMEDYERLLKSESRVTDIKNGWRKHESFLRLKTVAVGQLMWTQ